MTRSRGGLRIAMLLCCCALAGQATAGFREGVEAYRNGDFATAWEQWYALASVPPGQSPPAVQAEAMYGLGMLYWMGQGVTQDAAESAVWLERAANLNHAGAQSKLGFLYLSGSGVAADPKEAEKWLRMAAAQGDVDAQYNLGVMYRDGIGRPPNAEHAILWFREAAARGDALSASVVEHYALTGELPVSNTAAAAAPFVPRPAGEQSAGALLLDESWILARVPEHYTIQLFALSSSSRVELLAERHADRAPFATYQLENGGKPLYVMVWGDFATAAQAQAARAALPPSLQKPEEAWVRRIGEVQALIEAERSSHPGTSDAGLE